MLKEKITSDLKDAMKRGDSAVVSVLRMLISAIRNKEIEKRGAEFSDDDVQAVLATEARKRKESAASFISGGRDEMAKKEQEELAILKTYLPEEASEDEIRKTVKAVIEKTGAAGPKDMGKVIGGSMAQLKGRADGSAVQLIVKELLGT